MARFDQNHSSLNWAALSGSVVVLTGGALGIGAALVRTLHSHGANVVFGDIDGKGAEDVLAATSNSTVHFVKTDVTNYEDVVALFQFAMAKFGRVDHAIANAGLLEQPGWFDPRLGIDGVATRPSMKTVEVNFNGVLYFSNIACAYLAHGNSRQDKALVLVGSVASFKETPGLFLYQATKHAVLGLLRTLRLYVPKAYPGVRINAVCPSMTLTRMTDGIKEGWISAGCLVNTPEDVAGTIAAICVAGPGSSALWYDENDSAGLKDRTSAGGMNWDNSEGVSGRALLIMGGKTYDIEEGLDRTEEIWLGRQTSGFVQQGQVGLGDGTDWLKES